MAETCGQHGYNGPERRDYCDQHAVEEMQSKTNCRNIDSLKTEVDKKIPMWALIPLLGVLIGVLGVQWATYEKIGTLTLCIEQRLSVVDRQVSILEERQNVMRGQLK